MSIIKIYNIEKQHEGITIRGYLKDKLQYSRRSIIALKKNCGVRLNGNISHMNMHLKENDVLEVELQDTESENILPEKMELDIVFEDESLIVLNKKADMPVHPTRRHLTGTLANGLAYKWQAEAEARKIRPINRLDKDTSGLVVFAKNAHIQHLLSFNVGKEEFRKEYIAIVHGQMEESEGTIDQPIAREEEWAMRRVVREDGYRSVTHFKTLAVYDDYSIVSLVLETGRTHQIRVHMSYIGHPLLGDILYGGETDLIGRQALHARKITMLHPITKKWHTFEAPVPEDMQKLLDRKS
ncbi:MAG: RluA family pseudouridine synthase [Clostridia bacterium]|nr:RluA family pseudouridine synthase [Clostridia bacterium]